MCNAPFFTFIFAVLLRFCSCSVTLFRVRSTWYGGFQAFSFLCTFVPGSEKTIERTFAPVELSSHGNIRSLELSLLWNFRSSGAKVPRTFVPWNIRSCGTFVPRERTFQELSFLWNCRIMRTNISRTFAPNVIKHDLVAVRYVGHRESWLPWISLSHIEEATAAIAASASIEDTARQ